MQSPRHAAIGAVVAATALVPLSGTHALSWLAAAFAYGVAISVFVDLDHFVIARWRAGDWSHLRACLANPVDALTDQDWVFADLRDFPRERLLSHVAIATVLVAGFAAVAPDLAGFTAVVLAAHVAADLVHDAGLV